VSYRGKRNTNVPDNLPEIKTARGPSRALTPLVLTILTIMTEANFKFETLGSVNLVQYIHFDQYCLMRQSAEIFAYMKVFGKLGGPC
jgi:hypothetical protein